MTTPQIKIKNVGQVDLKSIFSIAEDALVHSVVASDKEKEHILGKTLARLEQSVLDPKRVFLKCSTEDIIGFILLKEYWNLTDLYVRPKCQGRGVGRALVTRALLYSKAKNSTGFVRVNSSLNAEAFYRSMGFTTYESNDKFPEYVVPLIKNIKS